MALTVSGSSDNPRIVGRDTKIWRGTVTFDSSYPTGGESATGISGKFISLDALMLDCEDNYQFQYDSTNDTIIAYGAGQVRPSLVVEEAVTVASHVGTLAYPPAYIIAVEVTATTTTGAYNVIPVGETPITKQVAVNFVTGGLTFLSTDLVTAVRITYVPQQPSGPFAYSNMVIDESVTAAAAKADLANQAAMVQYIYDDTDSKIGLLEPVGEAPSATQKHVIDIDDGSSATNIDSHADDEGNTLKVTYLKYAGFPADCCLGDGDVTLSSEAYNWNANGTYQHLVLPGLGTQVVGEEGDTTNAVATWEGPSGTAANVVATWDPKKNYLLTNNTAAMVTTAMPWVVLDTNQIAPQTSAQVPAGTDLSAVVARFISVGR